MAVSCRLRAHPTILCQTPERPGVRAEARTPTTARSRAPLWVPMKGWTALQIVESTLQQPTSYNLGLPRSRCEVCVVWRIANRCVGPLIICALNFGFGASLGALRLALLVRSSWGLVGGTLIGGAALFFFFSPAFLPFSFPFLFLFFFFSSSFLLLFSGFESEEKYKKSIRNRKARKSIRKSEGK